MNVKIDIDIADIVTAIFSAAKGRERRCDFAPILSTSLSYATRLQKELANGTWEQRIHYKVGHVVNANGKHRETHQPDAHTLILDHLCIALLTPYYAVHDPHNGLNCKVGCGLTAKRKSGSVQNRVKHAFYDRRDLHYLLKIDQRKCYDHFTSRVARRALKEIGVPTALRDMTTALGFVDSKLPVGTPLSPLLHHICELSTDRLMRELSPTAIRYADDHILFFATKEEAHAAKWRLKNLWWYTLGLRAKRHTIVIQPMNIPLDFCGTIYRRNPDKKWNDHNKGYTSVRRSTARRAVLNNNSKSYPSYFGLISKTDGFHFLQRLEKLNLLNLTDHIRLDRRCDAPNISLKELAERKTVFCIHDYYMKLSDDTGEPNWICCLISYPNGHGRRAVREFHGTLQHIVAFIVELERNWSREQLLPITNCVIEERRGWIFRGSTNTINEFADEPAFNE